MTHTRARRRYRLVLLAVLACYLLGLTSGLLASLLVWQYAVFLFLAAATIVWLHHLRSRWLRLVRAWQEEIRDDAARTVRS